MTTQLLPVAPIESFLHDVLDGLAGTPKRIPPKYFYDAAGSRLFDRITELDEYYLTRTEVAIMREHAADMADCCGDGCLLVEFGAGSLLKVRLLLERLHCPAGYVPVDVSGSHLRAAAGMLADGYPDLAVYPIVADFTRPFPLPRIPAARRVVYFPGSTIGNFDPLEADRLLQRMVRLAGPDGGVLLGVDLRKDPDLLERAYNDRRGVTAAFNRNLLQRINRELGADFDLTAFVHRAFFNEEQGRIEMHLVTEVDQRVQIGDVTIEFQAGESIHTENSYKYRIDDLAQRASDVGLNLERQWSDPQGFFAVLYFRA